MATMKFDFSRDITNVEWFIPLYIVLSLHFCYSIYDLILGENHIVYRILFAISMSLFLISTICTSVFINDKKKENIFICVLLYLIAYLTLITEKISGIINGESEDNDVPDK